MGSIIPDGDAEDEKYVNVGVSLPADLPRRLDEIARAKKYRSRSKLIATVLRMFVEQYDREQAGGSRKG